MSRSFKKNPIIKVGGWNGGTNSAKKKASRAIRRKLKSQFFSIGDGASYKRAGLNSYEIYDYRRYLHKPILRADEDMKSFKERLKLWVKATGK